MLQLIVGFLVGAVFVSIFSGSGSNYSQSAYGLSGLLSPTFGHYDELFLGDQNTFDPPQRKPGYVYRSTTYQSLYDKTWTEGGYPAQSCWGCRFAVDVTTKLQFHTMLDAGTGNGALTRLMRQHGKNAYGIELSRAVLEKECPDLLSKNYVEPRDSYQLAV